MTSTARQLFLGRRIDGSYIAGKICLVRCAIQGSDVEDLYFEHGDPLMCIYSSVYAERLFGRKLKPLEVTQVIQSWTEVPGPANLGPTRTYS